MPGSRSKDRLPAEGKIRTRGHVIADLSVNYVERLILQQGHAVQGVEKDYGYDLQMFTFDEGTFENGYLYLQLKATDELKTLKGGREISFKLSRADVNLWRRELSPVILIIWDAKQEIAYWLYVQAYFGGRADLTAGQSTFTIRVPTANVLNAASIEKLREYKNRIQIALRKVVAHND